MSVVGTSTSSTALATNAQSYNVFWSEGRYWVFYSDGTNLVYKTSTNGETWTDTTTIFSGVTSGLGYSVDLADSKIHAAYSVVELNNPLYYRMGTPNSNGSISWDEDPQVVKSGSASYDWSPRSIVVDSGGYPYILYHRHNANFEGFVVRNNNNNGIWSTDYDTAIGDPRAHALQAIRYTTGKIVAFDCTSTESLSSYVCDSTEVGTETIVTSAVDANAMYFTAWYSGANLWAISPDSDYDWRLFKETAGIWSLNQDNLITFTSLTPPKGTFNPKTNDYYVFWFSAKKGYFKKWTKLTTWEETKHWITESDPMPNNRQICTTSTVTSTDEALLTYLTGSDSSYYIKFIRFDVSEGSFMKRGLKLKFAP